MKSQIILTRDDKIKHFEEGNLNKISKKEVKVQEKEVKVQENFSSNYVKRSKTKKVKIRKMNLYLTILKLLNRGKNPTQTSKELNLSKQSINHYIRRLKQNGLLSKISYGTWELTQKGREKLQELQTSKTLTLGLSDDFKANLHALQIEVPILEGNLTFEEKGFKGSELRGWIPEYLRISSPLGLTIRNNNSKSITIYLWAREIIRTFDVNSLVIKSVIFVYDYLKTNYNVKINHFEPKVTTLHLSIRNKDLDELFNKGEGFEVFLNRNIKPILPNDKSKEAKAWIDSSPYLGVETNDIEYKENLIMMPERINKLFNFFPEFYRLLKDYHENLKLHKEVQMEQLETSKEIRNYIKELRDIKNV